MLGTLTFGFFCVLSVAQPDKVLVVTDATIQLPIANAAVRFRDFLWIGPAVLVVLYTYLHVMLGHWHMLGGRAVPNALPYLFNLRYGGAQRLSSFAFYILPVLVLANIAWKARPYLVLHLLLWALATGFAIWLAVLRLRRFPSPTRTRQRLRRAAWLLAIPVLSWLGFAGSRPLNLRGENLARAQLQRQNLDFAYLEGADLRDANLRDALLFGADLQNAQLTGADMTGAYLSHADLRGSQMDQANLTDAHFYEADLRGVNLAATRGLTAYAIGRACIDEGTVLPSTLRSSSLRRDCVTDRSPLTFHNRDVSALKLRLWQTAESAVNFIKALQDMAMVPIRDIR
jgi:hypothetical protein